MENSKYFHIWLGLSALLIAGSAAAFSVYGLAKLFSGAFLSVVVMAGSLELGKLVTASFLYRYWNMINWFQKVYMTIATIVLVFITSAGIFGYLSNAYQGATIEFEKQSTTLFYKEDRLTQLQEDKVFLQKELEVKLDRPLTNSKADKKLLKEFYALRKPSFSFTEAHHIEGVGKNPFRMEVSYRAANREQNNLLNKYKAGNLTKTEYATAMENLSDKKGGIRYKTDGRFIGTTGTQRSIATAAAKDAGLTKQLRSLIIKLCPKGQASGGRIGYKAAGAVGGTLECGINQFNKK